MKNAKKEKQNKKTKLVAGLSLMFVAVAVVVAASIVHDSLDTITFVAGLALFLSGYVICVIHILNTLKWETPQGAANGQT